MCYLVLGWVKKKSDLFWGSSPRPDQIFNETDTLAQLLGEKDTARSKMANPQTVLTERGPIKADLDQVKRGDKVTVI